MSVKYVVTGKINPSKPTEPKKFYAQVKSSGETTLRELAKMISQTSTVSTADVMAVLEGFIEIMPQEIARGQIVRLGDFGSFSLSIQSEGSEKEEQVNANSIKSNKLNFRPGKVVKDALKQIQYEKDK